MSLSGRVAFIAGGTGIVGSGIAISLLKAEAKVWIASRDENKLKEFKASLSDDIRSRLDYVCGEVGDEKDCIRIRDHILEKDKKINHVVSSLGGWWEKGVLSDQSVDEFNDVYKSCVLSHFVVYKTFAKKLAEQPGSTYTFITGGSGEYCESGKIFMPTASLIAVFSTSVYGVYYAARNEFHENKNLKISQLRISTWVRNKEDSSLETKGEMEVGNDFVGRFITKIAKNHKEGLIRVHTRTEANQEYESI